MITFIITETNFKLGIVLATSIAMHNIPEGIIIAMPIFHATGSKKKAFFYTLIAGLSELFGGIIFYIFFKTFVNNYILGCLYSIISGIMLSIAFNELIPASLSFKKAKTTYIFIIIGIVIMIINHLILS